VLREAGARGVDLVLVPVTGGLSGAEVWIADMQLPSRVYPGDRVPVSVDIQTNAPQAVTLTWVAAGQAGQGTLTLTDESDSVPLGNGAPFLNGTPFLNGALAFSFDVAESGFVSLRACLEAEADTFAQNNCMDGWVLVEGSPRVLVVGEAQERAALVYALQQSGLSVEEATPRQLPLTVQGLAEYAGLVLVNTPARAYASQTLTAIQEFVRDVGGGLVTVGGAESYGVGGWLGTPLETALPLEMRVQDPRRFPPLAMVIVIDKSGSMSAEEAGVSKIRLAAEAAIRVAESLNDTDTLAVVAFDDRPADTLGPVQMTERDTLITRLRRLQAGGGGIYVYESMNYAAELLDGVGGGADIQRHILLLADGSDAEHQPGVMELVAGLVNENVTASVVAIGSGSDVPFLTQVAKQGNGRFYLTQRAADLPAIFAEEAARAKRSYIVEEDFYPLPVSTWQPVQDVTATPVLHGYVATTPKSAAQVVWEATQGDPLLAVWQYGLGRSVAWTSDATARWAAGWVAWEDFAAFWGGIVREILPSPSDAGMSLRVLSGDESARVLVDVSGPDVDGLSLAVQITQSGRDPLSVSLQQTAPGRYEGSFIPPESGALLLRVYGDRNLVAGWSPPAPAEYIPGTGSSDVQAATARMAAQGAGEIITDPAAAFAPTLRGRELGQPLTSLWVLWVALLWPVDIAWRRLSLSRSDIVKLWAWLRGQWLQFRRPRQPGAVVAQPPTLAATLRRQKSLSQPRSPASGHPPVSPPLPITTEARRDETVTSAPAPSRSDPAVEATPTANVDTLAARLKRRVKEEK
ncbi:MAG: VWA domain-containing protein, partial [Anaerolineae bacterium]|nr:VWA domain-containing protein [Anaerolineae bacterium]